MTLYMLMLSWQQSPALQWLFELKPVELTRARIADLNRASED